MTRIIRSAAILTGALLFAFAASGAASAEEGSRSPTKMADATQARTAADAENEDPATCSKQRKRLWIEGEGWIVRRVTICR